MTMATHLNMGTARAANLNLRDFGGGKFESGGSESSTFEHVGEESDKYESGAARAANSNLRDFGGGKFVRQYNNSKNAKATPTLINKK